MEKTDHKKILKHLYHSSQKKVEFVDVPKMNFLMIDGEGDPNTSLEYKEAVEAIFGLSYALKFKIKKGAMQIDYSVMPLEGLWWTDNMKDFSVERKDEWKWTMMMMQPEYINKELVEKSREEVRIKKNPPALSKIKYDSFSEGKAAQIMHIGPFSEEGPTIEKLHQMIEQEGYSLSGLHHEIYLTDIRRAAPEKWKTIIRQPTK